MCVLGYRVARRMHRIPIGQRPALDEYENVSSKVADHCSWPMVLDVASQTGQERNRNIRKVSFLLKEVHLARSVSTDQRHRRPLGDKPISQYCEVVAREGTYLKLRLSNDLCARLALARLRSATTRCTGRTTAEPFEISQSGPEMWF